MLNRGELEGRFDAFYYLESFRELEKTMRRITSAKLRDFVLYMAGGATPKKEEGEKFYANSGIPFLRVQNILAEGLSLDDVIFINEETHNKSLNRSKVFEDNLLVTITGRIASSCVAPKGFEGNINQHSVVIRTESRETSEALAAFLNSNIGQKLALRRTTGGTRPALDYPALKSIPIVSSPAIVELMNQAYAEKAAKEREARELLASVDAFVLEKLGIRLPSKADNSLRRRAFYADFRQLSGGRFDPDAQHPERISAVKAIEAGKYQADSLRFVAHFVRVLTATNEQNLPYVGLEHIESNSGFYLGGEEAADFGTANIFKRGQVLFPKLRPYLNKVFQAAFDGVCSTEFHVLDGIKVTNEFLACFLRTNIVVAQTKRLMTGNTLPRLQTNDVESLLIPLPPVEIQEEIAKGVAEIYRRAKLLRAEGAQAVANARREVERMILGEI